ncbi:MULTISPECIES: ferritin-like domain-containing protein [Thermus]|uniref:ferritin-like domain-containing protein n=1 Tax=Thermus TaxID=270 RepID=UPI001F345209|nr:ferritin-like domain-containing protein [Thermus brockianus]
MEFLPRNQLAILRLLNALEDAFVGAYLGALPLIANKDILKAGGRSSATRPLTAPRCGLPASF